MTCDRASYGFAVEDVTANDSQPLVAHVQLSRVTEERGHGMAGLECLRHDVTADSASRSQNDDLHAPIPENGLRNMTAMSAAIKPSITHPVSGVAPAIARSRSGVTMFSAPRAAARTRP